MNRLRITRIQLFQSFVEMLGQVRALPLDAVGDFAQFGRDLGAEFERIGGPSHSFNNVEQTGADEPEIAVGSVLLRTSLQALSGGPTIAAGKRRLQFE
jgi:hypothetical protein